LFSAATCTLKLYRLELIDPKMFALEKARNMKGRRARVNLFAQTPIPCEISIRHAPLSEHRTQLR
jgi:hypothetical protein